MAVRELCRQGGYVIEHEYETAWLRWQGGRLLIGDHYGDPTCALIDPAGAWCLTAGEGVIVCRFSPKLSEQDRPKRCEQAELWRRGSPPLGGEGRGSGGELLLSTIDCYAAARRPAVRTVMYRSLRPKPVSLRVPFDIRFGASSARE